MSISMDPDLGERVRDAAERAGQPLSQWIAEAVAARLRTDSLAAFLSDYQAEHGAFTVEELAAARWEMGLQGERESVT